MGSPEKEMRPLPSEGDELTLSKANIDKMIKELVPSTRLDFETREVILNCCTEFIQLLSSEANEVCDKKTMKAEHVLTALNKLGCSDYTLEAEAVLKDCKAVAAKKKRQTTTLGNMGIPKEGLVKNKSSKKGKLVFTAAGCSGC